MSSNRTSGVVIPFPRPFRAPAPLRASPPLLLSRLAGCSAATPRGAWRRVAGEAAVLGLLGTVAALQLAVLAQAFGVCGR